MKQQLALVIAAAAVFSLAGCATGSGVVDTTADVGSASQEYSQEIHDMLPDRVRDAGVISVVGDVNPPWRISTGEGGTEGFQADLLAEFSAIMGIEFKEELVKDVATVKLGVQSGRNDIAFGPLFSSPDTRRDLIMIDYTLGRSSFLYPSGGDAVESYADLCGKSVAYPDGAVVFDAVFDRVDEVCSASGKEEVVVLPLTDNEAVILAVQSGRADAAGMSVHQASFAQSQIGGDFEFYVASEEESPADPLSMGFSVEEVELAQAVYAAWLQMFETGAYEELMEQYGMASIMVDEPVLHLDGAQSVDNS